MIRRPGLPRRPAGPPGSDRETSLGSVIGFVSRSDSGRTRRFAAPPNADRASLLYLLASSSPVQAQRWPADAWSPI